MDKETAIIILKNCALVLNDITNALKDTKAHKDGRALIKNMAQAIQFLEKEKS